MASILKALLFYRRSALSLAAWLGLFVPTLTSASHPLRAVPFATLGLLVVLYFLGGDRGRHIRSKFAAFDGAERRNSENFTQTGVAGQQSHLDDSGE